jgi:hypothetical protein
MNATRAASRPAPCSASCLKPVTAALAGVGLVATLLAPAPFAVAAEVTPAIFAREIDRDPWLLAQAGPGAGVNDPATIGARSLFAQAKATQILTVTNTLDDANPGSLRYAINYANAYGCSTDDFTIQFAIPGAGPHTIATNIGFSINCPATIIDGYSQPGSSPNAVADARNGSSAVPTIVIDASGMTGGSLFTIQPAASASQIRGLVLKNWPTGSAAISNSASSVTIAGNFIGVDESGSACATKPTSTGVISLSTMTIGGSTPADRNIIGCASGSSGGVVLSGSSNTVVGNLIGVGNDGLTPLGNQTGVMINSFGNTIGGQAVGLGNVIAHNSDYGVNYANTSSNIISGNDIFLNGLAGIDTTNTSYNPSNITIGGVTYGVSGTTITGTTEVYANFTTGLEFFDNDAALVGVDFGEGSRFADATSVSTAGAATPFSITIPGTVRNPTATATKSGGTTVFSAPFLTPDMEAKDVSMNVVSSLAFPATPLGSSSSPVVLNIYNSGNASLVIDSIANSLPSDFFDTTGGPPPSASHYCGVGSDSAGAPLAGSSGTVSPGSTCVMNLAFRPQASGTRTGVLTFNDADSPNYTVSVTLTGSGGTVTPLPTSVTFLPTSLALPGPVPAFSTLKINIANPNTAPAQNLAFSQSLPAGLVVAPAPNAIVSGTGCVGMFPSASAGASSFSVNAIFVPTSGACDVTIDVTAASLGGYPVTVPAGAITGNILSQAVANALSNTANLAVNAASLMLSPPSPVDFGAVTVGSSAPLSITLTNTGAAPLNFSSPFAVTGASAADFTFTDTCVPDPLPQLAPGASCTISLTYTPSAVGGSSASMSFASNTLTSPDVLNLTGTGTAVPVPVVSLSPTGMVFSPQTVGTTSAPQTATLTNVGTAPLAISSIVSSGDFAQSSDCGTSVAPTVGCTITVTFTPVTVGLRTGDVKIFSNASGSPHMIALDGDGLAVSVPTITAPSSVSFPTTQVGTTSSAVDVVIGNTGGSPLVVSVVEIVGSGFAKVADGCTGASVAPSSTCVVSLVFAPAAAGANAATLRIISNAPTSPTFVGLGGDASAAPVGTLSASASVLSFTGQVVDTTSEAQSIVVTNTGGATVTVSSITVSGDFAQTNNCVSVPGGGSCTVSITFTPTQTGTRTGVLSIVSDATNSPLSVSLSGAATPIPAPVIELSASSLTYGNTLIGGGATQVLTVRNIGGAPLTIGSLVVSGEFQAASGCLAAVPAGESCRIDMGFRPTVPGPRSGRVDVLSNASNGTKGADLAGTGCRFSFLNRVFALVCQ